MAKVEYCRFEEDPEQLVHMMMPGNAEYTLCGDAFDLDAVEEGVGACHPVKRGPVTCPKCAEVIIGCRGVRVMVADEQA